MSEHIYLRRRNEMIRCMRFEQRMSAKEVAAALRGEWPEINVWVVYRVCRPRENVSNETITPKLANQKRGGKGEVAVK